MSMSTCSTCCSDNAAPTSLEQQEISAAEKSDQPQQNEEISAAEKSEQSQQQEISAVEKSEQSQQNEKNSAAGQLNVERRVVLQLREGCGLKDPKNNKIHAAFEIFNVAATVASFCPVHQLKGELLEAFKEYVLRGKQLSTADREALSRVTRIGNAFLCSHIALKKIDLSPLSNLTTVGDCFLSLTGFKTIDLSPLSNVTTVGDSFLEGCDDLQTIDLSPLSNLTTIGDSFLRSCYGLTTIDLTPLSNVTTVGDHFLYRCSGNVEAQGKEFLSRK